MKFILLICGIPATIFRAYVATCLWWWFAVPFFHVPPIGKAQAYGLVLLLSLLISQSHPTDPEQLDWSTEKRIIFSIIYGFFGSCFIWALGWFTHLLVAAN